MNPQLQPLEVNPKTGEPFLRLLSHKNIILTPARASDGPLMISIFNDERVYPWLIARPFPYLSEHADLWLINRKPLLDAVLEELEAARNEPLKIVDACPVRAIREVKEDGTDTFLGEISISLAQQPWELEGSGKLSQDTPRRDPSDPDIWTLGSNQGSVRVIEKNGFKFRKTIDDAIDVRGTKRGVHVLEWNLHDEAKVDV
ncbi:hypothetical protein DFH06DRAFT_1186597 [Mycena polygramma]|nr:hypothetical protein DFH06DRAFT_1186597 [Mycena polygramma]